MGAGGYFTVCSFQQCHTAVVTTARAGIDDPQAAIFPVTKFFVGMAKEDTLGIKLPGLCQHW